eukprot:CAMPEP_0185190846 /NCGR_PEP_ID=MMETSP1140-20130426/13254_1 /TAXON_ID=298111 /ORGANISM="Pavlova sp., Strain CCMP459" /LENGTH=85 /DNA_ID=CAMNT_0027757521 /DNA_START=34 /DNA_END=289 /DNA_ORIENTATION=+
MPECVPQTSARCPTPPAVPPRANIAVDTDRMQATHAVAAARRRSAGHARKVIADGFSLPRALIGAVPPRAQEGAHVHRYLRPRRL